MSPDPSVKGIAYLGALEQMIENGFELKQLKRVAGTSAGAISAALIGAGYSLDELKEAMESLNFREILDEKSGNTQSTFFKSAKGQVSQASVSNPSATSRIISRLSSDLGIYDGDYIRNWVETKLYVNTDIHDITFAELHEKHLEQPEKFRDIFVVGANLSLGTSETFNYLKTPKVIIADAVRISMSIPFLFDPATVYIKVPIVPTPPKDAKSGKEPKNYTREILQPSYVYTDGGVSRNYPIAIFDFAGFVYNNIAENDPKFWEVVRNPNCLGMETASKVKIDYFKGEGKMPEKKTQSIVQYSKALFQSLMAAQNVEFVSRGELERTVLIDNEGVDTLDFDLSQADKEKLIKSGRAAVKAYYNTANAVVVTPIPIQPVVTAPMPT